MNRAYSILEIKAVKEDERVIEGIASTPRTDRVGDIVEPLGAQFALPLPLLLDHNSREQVGHVEFAKPNKAGIPFRARIKIIPEPGEAQDLVNKAWHFVKYGLRQFVSIGFKELEDGVELLKNGGARFTSWEWLELSLVSIPAQPDAVINQLKSIDAQLLAATGHKQNGIDRTSAGASATKSTPVVKAKEAKHTMIKKTIAEQISAFEATRQAKSARMTEIMDTAAEKGETLDESATQEYDGLKAELKSVDEHLVRLREHEKTNIASAAPVNGNSQDAAANSRGGTSIVNVRRAAPAGVPFVRLLAARFMAKEEGVSPAEIAESRGWGEEVVNVLRMPKHILQKAAIGAASTTDSTWAAPLVTYENLQSEFIELLRPKSVIARIPGLRRVPFNVKIPRETGETTGYWVGQGSPKPVSKGALDTVTLDFAKVAGITFQTQELLRFSRPNSEQLMINSLVAALTKLVDRDFLDPAKAAVSGESPASITNGSSSVAATGTSADAFRANFGSLLTLYSIANFSLDGLVFVMTQTQAMRLGLMRTDFGAKEFPDINKDGGSIEGFTVVTSENIVANGGSPADGAIIVAMNASDILLADDGAVDVDISTEASIQTDNAPDSPATASTVMVSLWQRNLIGIRCERFITWAKARTNSVVYISGANYR